MSAEVADQVAGGTRPVVVAGVGLACTGGMPIRQMLGDHPGPPQGDEENAVRARLLGDLLDA